MEVDEQEAEPHPRGYVALDQWLIQQIFIINSDLEHDHWEEEAPEHGAELGGAHQPGPGEDEVVAGYHHQGHLHNLKQEILSVSVSSFSDKS